MAYRLISRSFLEHYFSRKEAYKGKYGYIITPSGRLRLYVQASPTEKAQFNEALEAERERHQSPTFHDTLYVLEPPQFLTKEEVADDPYIQGVLSGKITSSPRLHLNRWLTPEERVDTGKAQKITFYSYKGGVGRTTAVAFTAVELARMGHAVVVVDFDLEAPSLSAVLLDELNAPAKGVVDYLLEKPALQAELNGNLFMKLYARQKSEIESLGELWVIGAGHLTGSVLHVTANQHYLEKLSLLDVDLLDRHTPSGHSQSPLAMLLRDIEAHLQPDYILIDSRTGLADIGGSLLFQYSDAVVCLLYNQAQHRAGASLLASNLAAYKRKQLAPPTLLWTHSLLRYKPDVPEGKKFHTDLQVFLERLYQELGLTENGLPGLVLSSAERETALGYIQRLEALEQLNHQHFYDARLFGDYHRLANRILLAAPSRQKDRTGSAIRLIRDERRAILSEIHAVDAVKNWTDDFLLADREFRTALDSNLPVICIERSMVEWAVRLLEKQETVVRISPPRVSEGDRTAGDNDWVAVWESCCIQALQEAKPEFFGIPQWDTTQPAVMDSGFLQRLRQADKRLEGAGTSLTLLYADHESWKRLPYACRHALVSLAQSYPAGRLKFKILIPGSDQHSELYGNVRYVRESTPQALHQIVLSGFAHLSQTFRQWLEGNKLRVPISASGIPIVLADDEAASRNVMTTLFGKRLHPRLQRVEMAAWMENHIILPDEPQAYTLYRVLTAAIEMSQRDERYVDAVATSDLLVPPLVVLDAWKAACQAWVKNLNQDQLESMVNELSLIILEHPLSTKQIDAEWGEDRHEALRKMLQIAKKSPTIWEENLHRLEPLWYGLSIAE